MLIVSHRCLGFEAPENSLSAFTAALNSVVDQVEVDLRLTSDHQYVALHFPWFLSKHAQPQLISRATIEKTREAGIVTLEEILEAYKDNPNSKLLRLEVKVPGRERELVQIIESAGLLDSICIASWSLRILQKFAQISPSLQLSYSFLEGFPSSASLRQILETHSSIKSVCLVPLLSRLFPNFLVDYAIPGCQLFIVESGAHTDLKLLKALGVNGFFTKNPLALMGSGPYG